jgi:hypothetical protein
MATPLLSPSQGTNQKTNSGAAKKNVAAGTDRQQRSRVQDRL